MATAMGAGITVSYTHLDVYKRQLIRPVSTVADAFAQWNVECNERFNQLKANEEELNRIFIDIYGLQDELTPEVEDKDVTEMCIRDRPNAGLLRLHPSCCRSGAPTV